MKSQLNNIVSYLTLETIARGRQQSLILTASQGASLL